MAKNETLMSEKEQKRLMEQGRTGKLSSAKRFITEDIPRAVAAQEKRLSKNVQDYGALGFVKGVGEEISRGYSGLTGAAAGPAASAVKGASRVLIGSKGTEAVGLGNQAEPPADKEMTARPAGTEGMTVRPAPESGAGTLTGEYATGDPLGTSGFTAKRIRFGGKPGTRYEDGKGGFMEVTGADAVRRGGGTVSVVSGPGSNDFTKEEWEKMSGAQRTQANVDSYKAQTQAIRDSMAKPRQAAAAGGALTGQQSPFERRKTLREYRMAAGNLQDDLRRGRISAKKGKVIAATLMDHYDKALGGDLQKLMQEEVRQGGQLMTAQERSAGLLGVAKERQRGAAELAGMQGPEEFSMQVIGENLDGTKKYGLVGSGGTMPGTGANQTPTDPARLEVLMQGDRAAIEALPEEQRAAAIAKFEGRYNVGY